MPSAGTGLRIGAYTVEVVQTTGQSVKTARLIPDSAAAPPESSTASGNGQTRE
jgi:hypothetical protein